MTKARRISQALLGVTLAAFGVVGLAATWGPAPAQAQSGQSGSHETMHEMMEAMHGEEALERMHEVEGADEMMDQCASMMDAMGGMSEMMNGGGMSGMMGGGGMSGMMDGQGSSNMMSGMMGR